MTSSNRYRYDIVAIFFHWASALLVVFLLALGLFMKRGTIDLFLKFELYQLHKSVGITLFFLTLLRLGWRLSHDVPDDKIALPKRIKTGAALMHWTLYALLLIAPLSGWALVSAAKINIPTLYFGLFPMPHIHFLTMHADGLSDVTRLIHTVLVFTLGVLAVGHVSAALLHTLVFKDGILERMLPVKLRTGTDKEL